jgi:hypothetical protein
MHTQLQIFASIVACLSLILLALNFPGVFENRKTRYSTVFLIWCVAANIIAFTDVDNSMAAYFNGIFASWFALRAFLLIIVHAPHQHYSRVRLYSTTPNALHQMTIGDNIPAIWERFPSSVSWARLAWTVDLLASFRGIGWNFLPCSYDVHCGYAKALEAMVIFPGDFFTASLKCFKFCARFILALCGSTSSRSGASRSSIILNVDTDRHQDIIPFHFWSRLLYVTMSLTASFALVDLTYSSSNILSIMFHLGCSRNPALLAQPRPWGANRAIFNDGIAGKLLILP